MLDSIEIKNFKAIQSPDGLTLNNLANVNYLVGKNGCGKSSVLEGVTRKIFNKADIEVSGVVTAYIKIWTEDNTKAKYLFQDDLFLAADRNSWVSNIYNKVLNTTSIAGSFNMNFKNFDFRNWIEDNLSSDSEKICKILNDSKILSKEVTKIDKPPMAQGDDESTKNAILLTFKDTSKISLDKEAGGVQFLIKLLVFLNRIILAHPGDNLLICIEEPENSLHPAFQKFLPTIFQGLSTASIQFIISTHSPFIISAAGELVEEEKSKWDTDTEGEFQPSQKVYQIDEGQCKEAEGVWGYDSIGTSAKMLGAGLDSVISPAKYPCKVKNYIIYCEGNKKSDYIIYNQIFRTLRDKKQSNFNQKEFLFISCASCGETYSQWLMANVFYKAQKGQLEIKGLVDNDPENPKLESWKEEGIKVLGRRELENYLFDFDIAKAYLRNQALSETEYYSLFGCTKENYKEFDMKHVVSEGEHSQEFRKNNFKHDGNDKLKLELAKLITPENPLYKELHDCIF